MKLTRSQTAAKSIGEYAGMTFGLIIALAFVTFICLAITGWVLNVINVLQITDPITVADGLAIIGIFAIPLGMIMGWVI